MQTSDRSHHGLPGPPLITTAQRTNYLPGSPLSFSLTFPRWLCEARESSLAMAQKPMGQVTCLPFVT